MTDYDYDESLSWPCQDRWGYDYPEHDFDHGDNCRRCDAELDEEDQ